MNTPRKSISPDDVERLFRDLVDSGELRFPKRSKIALNDAERLSKRMEEALRNDPRGLASSAAELIKREREKRQITSQRVAKSAGIALDTYKGLESGEISPSEVQPAAFGKVLKALGIDLESYLGVHSGLNRRQRSSVSRVAALRASVRTKAEGGRRLISAWLVGLAEAMKS